jgi:hypothetical protein
MAKAVLFLKEKGEKESHTSHAKDLKKAGLVQKILPAGWRFFVQPVGPGPVVSKPELIFTFFFSF